MATTETHISAEYLHPEPGDLVVLRMDDGWSCWPPEQLEQMLRCLQDRMPEGVRVLALDNEIDIELVKAERES